MGASRGRRALTLWLHWPSGARQGLGRERTRRLAQRPLGHERAENGLYHLREGGAAHVEHQVVVREHRAQLHEGGHRYRR
jgi:hypothetical protein